MCVHGDCNIHMDFHVSLSTPICNSLYILYIWICLVGLLYILRTVHTL